MTPTPPKAVEPEVVQSEVVELEATESEAAEPEAVNPKPAELEVVKPEVVESGIVEEETTEPKVVEPEVIKPEAVVSEVVEMKTAESEVVKSEAVEPKVVKPEIVKPKTVKRPWRGRYWLLGALALVILLVVGFALPGYLPASWVQQLQLGQTILSTEVAQLLPSEATPTTFASPTVEMTAGSVVAGMALEPTTTLTPSTTTALSTPTEILTVVTLPPTGAATSTQGSSSTGQPGNDQSPVAPTVTPTSTILIPSFISEPSPEISPLTAEMQALYRLMQATLITLPTLRSNQPTNEEIAAMRAQVIVVIQRMAKLTAQLQAVQTNSETMSTKTSISPKQVRDLLILMRHAVNILLIVQTDTTTDEVNLAQAKALLEQLWEMMKQVQILAVSTQTTTPMLAVTPTPAIVTNEQLIQLETNLSQMKQMMQKMQSLLQQMQNQ